MKWNETNAKRKIAALEKKLEAVQKKGQNVTNAERKNEALEKQVQEMKEALERAKPLIQENQRLRRKLRAGEGAAEIIVDIVGALLSERPTQISVPTPQILKGSRKKPDEPNVGIVHLSDLHMGSVTPSFDSQICKDRLREMARKVTKCLKVHNTSMQVDDLRVYLGGDLVEGEQIFPHQAHLIDSSVFQQACFDMPEVLAEVITGWASVFRSVKVVGVRGNHGRNGPKSTSSNPQTNWDAVTMRIMSMLLKPLKNVEIDISDTFYAVDPVFSNWGSLIVHGDQMRGGHAGYAWYGVGRKAYGWADSIPYPWKGMFVGHFHTPVSFRQNGRWIFGNGTLKSEDPYSLSELSAAGDPCQRLVILNERHGPICDLMINITSGVK